MGLRTLGYQSVCGQNRHLCRSYGAWLAYGLGITINMALRMELAHKKCACSPLHSNRIARRHCHHRNSCAMLLPALSKSRIKAEGISCLNNLRQLQLGWSLYSGDSDDKIVRTGGLNDLVTFPNDPAGQPGGAKSQWVLEPWIRCLEPQTSCCFKKDCSIHTSTPLRFLNARQTGKR